MGKKKRLGKPVKNLNDVDPNTTINVNEYKKNKIGEMKKKKYGDQAYDYFSRDNNYPV